MDTIDKQIISLLQDDAKITIKEIAHRLNLSTTPIFDRIKKLEENKVITGYHAQIDKKALDLSLMVFCAITLKEHHANYLKKFERDIMGFSGVILLERFKAERVLLVLYTFSFTKSGSLSNGTSLY